MPGALRFYAIGLVPITVARLYVNLCVAHENTATGARGAAVSVVVNAVAALALTGPLPDAALWAPLLAAQHALVVADLGYAGLALASTIAASANALYVGIAAHARYGAVVGARDLLGWLRIAISSAAMSGVLYGLARIWPLPEQASIAGLLALAAHVALGAIAFAGGMAALGAPELRGLLARAR